jgi:hypothetical protein
MNQLRPFYKLLSIPEETDAPTPFQLLGFSIAQTPLLTRGQIEQAALERKKLLRQNIPGPQVLPIMSLAEQAIDRAAAALLKELGLTGEDSPGHSARGTSARGPGGPHAVPATPAEQPLRPVEHAPRSHAKKAPAGPSAGDSWQDALHWVMTESRSLYEQARHQNDLGSAAEALRTYLTARRFLQIIGKE